MKITEAKVKLVSNKSDKLKAFCSITLDDEFVIRDIKIIEGTSGYFVAMPSRKLTDRCVSCGCKNHLRAAYRNECGSALRPDRVPHDDDGRAKLHADIAHPNNSNCRERIQERVVEAFKREITAANEAGCSGARDDDHSAVPSPSPSGAGAEPPVAMPESMATPSDQGDTSTGADDFASGIC